MMQEYRPRDSSQPTHTHIHEKRGEDEQKPKTRTKFSIIFHKAKMLSC